MPRVVKKKWNCSVCFQLVGSEESSHLTNASSLSDTFPSTPESPGEMFVSPLGSVGSTHRVAGIASPRLSGISGLVKTPKQKQRQSVDLSGLKALVKTPKTLKSPALSGVKQLMKTPKAHKSPALANLKKLVRTPKDVADTAKLDDIRKLVKTPKPLKSPELPGIKKLVKTPKAQKSPALDGVKKLLTTPKDVAKTPELDGIRRLLKTPKMQKSPSLSGVRKLLKTPKQQQSPMLAGVRQLVKTPKSGPKSPNFIGVSEMLTSPQTDGLVRQKSMPKKKAARQVISPVSRVLSPKTRRTRGRKILEKTTETEMAESHTDGKEVDVVISALSPRGSFVSRRGKGRNTSQEPAVTSEEAHVGSRVKVTKASSTPVAKTRKKTSKTVMFEVSLIANCSPKTPVRSSTKTTKTSKKADDASVLAVVPSVDQAVVTRHKTVKKSAVAATKKSTRNVIDVAAGSSPVRLRGAGRASRSETTTNVARELALADDNTAGVDSRKKTPQQSVGDDCVKVAQQVGKKRAARKQNDTVVIGHAKAAENIEVDVEGRSKGSRSAKKAIAPIKSNNKPKTNVKKAKGTASRVDTAADEPVAGRRRKPVASDEVESQPTKKLPVDQHGGSAKSPVSTRRGKRQVTVAAEDVNTQQTSQENAAIATVSGERRRKRQYVDEEPEQTVESSKVKKTPSRSQKRPRTAKEKRSDVDPASDEQFVGRRGNQATRNQLESPLSSSVAAKSPVTTRRGKRQPVVKETLPVAESVKVQQKGQENHAGGRRGKRDDLQQAFDSSNVKTPSRSRKRLQTSEVSVDPPAAKRLRQRAEVVLVVEEPIKKAAEPIGQTDKSQKTTGAKKMSQSAVKKSGGKKANDIEIMDNASNSVKKSGSKKVDNKLKVVDNLLKSKLNGYKKKESTKVMVEKRKMAVVSPPATRNRRTKR